jgi:hypothetical protein
MPNQSALLVGIFVAMTIAWALIQLLGKEMPATPGRSSTGGTPGGLPPAPRPPDRGSRSAQQMPATARWVNPPPPAASPPPRLPNASDEVIILSSETLRNPLPVVPRTGVTAQKTRTVRRPKTPATPARPEPARSRSVLGGAVTQSVAQSLERPIDLQPLTNAAALASSQAAETPRPSGATDRGSPQPTIDVKSFVESRARVREAFLLSEILQPPRALRKLRRG